MPEVIDLTEEIQTEISFSYRMSGEHSQFWNIYALRYHKKIVDSEPRFGTIESTLIGEMREYHSTGEIAILSYEGMADAIADQYGALTATRYHSPRPVGYPKGDWGLADTVMLYRKGPRFSRKELS